MTDPMPIDRAITGATDADRQAIEDLLPLVYQELRQLAGAYLRADRPGQTLQPTALVHEAYLRLTRSGDPGWDGKHHFFGAAANAMRQIIVDHARKRLAAKRGGGWRRVQTEQNSMCLGASPEDVVALNDALATLEAKQPRLSQVVVLRYFGGLSEEDAAGVLGVSARTVRRDWVLAKAFLAEVFGGECAHGSASEDA